MARVEYVVRLDAPKHIEHIDCAGSGRYHGEASCRLTRSGRVITFFMASAGQAKKIRRRRGKLQITDRMIERMR